MTEPFCITYRFYHHLLPRKQRKRILDYYFVKELDRANILYEASCIIKMILVLIIFLLFMYYVWQFLWRFFVDLQHTTQETRGRSQ